MNPVAAPPHVTLSGDRAGEYVIEEERPDGRLVLAPDSDDRYPKVTWADILKRSGGRELTAEEFDHAVKKSRSAWLSSYASRRAAGTVAVGLPDVRVRVSTVPVSRYLARTANITEGVAG